MHARRACWIAKFTGTTRDAFDDNRQFYGNAFSLMRRAERFLLDSLPVASRIVPGRMEREDTPLLPIEAIREALANAFVHRDYAIGGGAVSVALFDDRLEVISSGDLHFGLTPEALFREHESRPWNPMIAQTFYKRGRHRNLAPRRGKRRGNAGETRGKRGGKHPEMYFTFYGNTRT